MPAGVDPWQAARVFAWWRQHRRDRILQQPFPAAWREIMRRQVGHLRYLSAAERQQLEALVQVFLAEKVLEGCGGLVLTDEIRVTVAANACILLLGLSHDMYRSVDSVLIYPSTVRPPQRGIGFFETPSGPVEAAHPLLGEAHRRGPVIIVWDEARRGSRHPRSGHNVVFHEFAHKLDMLDGEVDGTPPLRGSARLRRWAEVCSRVYLELRERTERGEPTLIDGYGAHSEAEFFAVATETFFERAPELQRQHPELYEILRDFYRQDPAARMAQPP